ncbi:ATP-binding protein [Nocardiopsis exhalans]|uniref:ATP-binding protein n=1 Tax=Nocardiopsis exhalans TaxID=163604 RepID=A0ABY5DFJ9_9ACTN|nr:ATP-binding protein [Nocardiopsis exhalans]USY21800.1 ATP-binding protein [Nocardiopsis exhalans]
MATALASESLLGRLARIARQRGLDTTPGPINDGPSPDEPGHPAYHHRQRVNAALAKLNRAVPPRYTNATADMPQVARWASEVAMNPTTADSLMLWGPTGTGKTHLAYGALRLIAESGPGRFGVVAATFPDLYAALRPGASDPVERERTMRRVMQTPLLLLDDLGTTKDSAWTEETTYRIINHRYNRCLPMIITSNESPIALPNLVGDRIASRLIEMTTRVEVSGADRRKVAR